MCREKEIYIKENPEIKISEVEEGIESGLVKTSCEISAGRFWLVWHESSYGEGEILSGNKAIEKKKFNFFFPMDARNRRIVVKVGNEIKYFSIIKKD